MRRSSGKIIESILEICKEPSGKTNVVYQANLNFNNANRYISLLVKSGHLEASDTTPTTYTITPKGLDLLERMKSVNAEIGYNEP